MDRRRNDQKAETRNELLSEWTGKPVISGISNHHGEETAKKVSDEDEQEDGDGHANG